MYRKLWTVALLVFAAPVWAQTPQALEVVPEDALGFILLKDIGQTSENLEGLAKRLKIEERVSLTEMMQKIGEKGFNEKGSVVVMILKGDKERLLPAVVFALPISDFQKVREQLAIKDGKDGINVAELTITSKLLMRVTGNGIKAETTMKFPILVAKKGDFALLTAGHNQAILEQVLNSKNSVAASVKPAQDWIAEQGIATVITQHGIKAGIGQLLAGPGQPSAEAQAARIKTTLTEIEKNVQLIAMGSRIEKEGHARHTTRIYFDPSGTFAKWASKTEPIQENILTRFPDQPYLFTLLAHISPQTKFDLVAQLFAELPADKADPLAKNAAKMLQRISDVGLCVYLADKPSAPPKEATIAHLALLPTAFLKVDDAVAFVEEACSLCKGTHAAALAAQKDRGEIKLQEIKIGDRTARLITFTGKVDARTNYNQVLLLTAMDKQTVLLSALPDASKAEAVVNRYLKDADRSLGANAMLQKTRALMPGQVQVAAFLNFNAIGIGTPNRSADSPPLGFSLRTFPAGVETQTVLPFDTLQALVDAARSVKDAK